MPHSARKKPQHDEQPQADQDAEHDPDQAWYWTPEWQEAEREADEDHKAGRVERFDTPEQFLAALRKRIKPK